MGYTLRKPRRAFFEQAVDPFQGLLTELPPPPQRNVQELADRRPVPKLRRLRRHDFDKHRAVVCVADRAFDLAESGAALGIAPGQPVSDQAGVQIVVFAALTPFVNRVRRDSVTAACAAVGGAAEGLLEAGGYVPERDAGYVPLVDPGCRRGKSFLDFGKQGCRVILGKFATPQVPSVRRMFFGVTRETLSQVDHDARVALIRHAA